MRYRRGVPTPKPTLAITVLERWKREDVHPNAELATVRVVQRGRDSRSDVFAIVFRTSRGSQFAITGTGLEMGELVQAIGKASFDR